MSVRGKNAVMNGVGDKVRTEEGDAFEMLRRMGDKNERFRAVSLDPPALIKRGKDHAAGLAAYRKLNKLALALVEDNGVLASCSCSRHLGAEELRGVLQRAAHRGRSAASDTGKGPPRPGPSRAPGHAGDGIPQEHHCPSDTAGLEPLAPGTRAR